MRDTWKESAKAWQVTSPMERFKQGDHSPQVIAGLAARYARIEQVRRERYDSLYHQTIDQIWEVYRGHGLPLSGAKSWRGRFLKQPLISSIIEIEYPRQEYLDALGALGVDAEEMLHLSTQYIERKER